MQRTFSPAVLFFLGSVAAAAAPPARPLLDRYGDPLPQGAVARLGAARLRHAWMFAFALLPDNKTVVTAGGDQTIRFWDLSSGRQVRAVRLAPALSRLCAFSPDGKVLAANEGGGATDEKLV